MNRLGDLDARESQQGRHAIDGGRQRFVPRRTDRTGPADHERDGLGLIVPDVLLLAAVSAQHLAVIAAEDDDRVVGQSFVVQEFEQPPKGVVHRRHRTEVMHQHAPGQFAARSSLIGVEFLEVVPFAHPGNDLVIVLLVPLAVLGRGDVPGRLVVTAAAEVHRRRRSIFRLGLGPDGGELLRTGVSAVVRRTEVDEERERLVGIALGGGKLVEALAVVLDEVHRHVGFVFRLPTVFDNHLVRARAVEIDEVRVVQVIGIPEFEARALPLRYMFAPGLDLPAVAQMELADIPGAVTRLAQGIANAVAALFPGELATVVDHAGRGRVSPCVEGRSRRRTQGGCAVRTGKDGALLGEGVQVRGRDRIGAQEPQRVAPVLIGVHKDNVRSLAFGALVGL